MRNIVLVLSLLVLSFLANAATPPAPLPPLPQTVAVTQTADPATGAPIWSVQPAAHSALVALVAQYTAAQVARQTAQIVALGGTADAATVANLTLLANAQGANTVRQIELQSVQQQARK